MAHSVPQCSGEAPLFNDFRSLAYPFGFKGRYIVQGPPVQACTEIILPTGGSTNQSIFPAYEWHYSDRASSCQRAFGIHPRRTWITTHFGGFVRAHHVDLRFSTKEDPEWLKEVRKQEIHVQSENSTLGSSHMMNLVERTDVAIMYVRHAIKHGKYFKIMRRNRIEGKRVNDNHRIAYLIPMINGESDYYIVTKNLKIRRFSETLLRTMIDDWKVMSKDKKWAD
ncbi:hypothetical protein G4B88_010307 [Cannabis sativa]|uniref:Uncharacterized protein n=1 Tax=Cannabis sativa TaxID=3483 RepID=A0A7J6I6Q2_CANSA|nr:hypothetical protein G4B88_010307 [Cannabis sativa]